MNENFCRGAQGGWTKYPGNPVLGGELGVCFDICMLRENGRYAMYFSWRTKLSVAVCFSEDGIRWSEPQICVAPLAREDGREDRINRPSVVKVGETYHMWYTGQDRLPSREGHSYIFHAQSRDGIRFERTGRDPVLMPACPWELGSVMCPNVLWDEDRRVFRMWYSAGEQYEPNAIGYAESADGIRWNRKCDGPVFSADPASDWECHKVTACQVFRDENTHWMFYIGFRNENYAQIGIARSKDGISGWERSALNPIIAPDEGAWDGEACYKPFVMYDGREWKLWYNGRTGKVEQIGLAVHPGPDFDF